MLDADFTAIPANVDVLMIVDPPTLNAQQLYAIDQFVLRGGRALVFVDPISELAKASAGMDQQSATSGFRPAETLPRLGHFLRSAKDRRRPRGRAVRAGVRRSAQRCRALSDLAASDQNEFNPTDQVTANLQSINLASVGALFPAKGATTKFTPLVESSDQASLLDAAQVRRRRRRI